MDFSLSEDQRLLSDSLARLLTDHYDFGARRAILATPSGWSAERWSDYAQLGLLGLTVAEEDGGFGGGAVETMLVMEAFGRAMVLEPYLASAVLGGAALRLSGHRALLPGLLQGTIKLAFAHETPPAAQTVARRQAGGWRLDGRKTLVLHGAVADYFVVSAAVSEGDLALFLVPFDAVGLGVQASRLIDGSQSATVRLNETAAEYLGGGAVVAGIIDIGVAAVCAEAVGVMETAYALTVDYLNTRQQFGRPIGRNQALQHRIAEMLVALEQARSMAMLAAMAVTLEDVAERQTTLSQAKVRVSRSARQIGQTSIQLHGGIGVTEEYAVGHAHRRLMVLEQLFGTESWHMQQLAERL
jgi:alkylation response protein AidB-like acyl-CoA dehydrogenase